jgi:hypothetical protein
MAELTLKERCVRRFEGLKDGRRGFESDAKEIAAYAQPARSRWLASDTNKGRQPNRKLNNSHGIFAFRTLQGGMTSGLSSASRPWFNLTTYDEGLGEDQEVKEWLAEVERRMYAFLAQTNFYGAVKTGYLEMGLFGTEACVMLEHMAEGAVCHQLTFGEYFIGAGTALSPNALYRECVKTVKQAVEEFGKDHLDRRITSMYDSARYDELITFHHAIEENDERDPNRMDFRGKAWRSVYWDPADGDKGRVIQKNGFEEQPFWAPRWDTTGADVWGQGPGHDALPDLRELQLQTKRKAEATDMHVHPEIVSSSKVKLRRQPRSVVSAAEIDVGKLVTVPYQVPYQTIGVIREDINDNKEAINQATYADLFMAITNMAGIQPRNIEEIAARNEEKLTQLGPVIERVNNEKLEVAIERTLGIMQRARLLPPAPEALRNAPDLKINFISILTQMQRMVGLGPIERTVGFVGNLAAVNPEALDKLNVDEAIDEYAERGGCPPKIIRTADEVDEIRNDRAQAANMERLLAAAPAAKDGAQAAALMAQAGQGSLPIAGAMPL